MRTEALDALADWSVGRLVGPGREGLLGLFLQALEVKSFVCLFVCLFVWSWVKRTASLVRGSLLCYVCAGVVVGGLFVLLRPDV